MLDDDRLCQRSCDAWFGPAAYLKNLYLMHSMLLADGHDSWMWGNRGSPGAFQKLVLVWSRGVPSVILILDKTYLHQHCHHKQISIKGASGSSSHHIKKICFSPDYSDFWGPPLSSLELLSLSFSIMLIVGTRGSLSNDLLIHISIGLSHYAGVCRAFEHVIDGYQLGKLKPDLLKFL